MLLFIEYIQASNNFVYHNCHQIKYLFSSNTHHNNDKRFLDVYLNWHLLARKGNHYNSSLLFGRLGVTLLRGLSSYSKKKHTCRLSGLMTVKRMCWFSFFDKT